MKKLILLLTLLVSTLSYGQWAMKKGHAYIKAGTFATRGHIKFNDNGGEETIKFQGYLRRSIYARVGINDKWTVVAAIPNVRVNLQISEFDNRGNKIGDVSKVESHVGDINLSIERNILKGPVQVALQLTLGLPTGNTEGTHRTGDGEFNQRLKFFAGTGYKIFNIPTYSKAGLWYNNRTHGFADQYGLNLETGVQLFERKLLVLGRFNTLKFIESTGVDRPLDAQFSEFGNNFEITSTSWEASYNFYKGWSVSYGHVTPLSGKNLLSASSDSIGLILKF